MLQPMAVADVEIQSDMQSSISTPVPEVGTGVCAKTETVDAAKRRTENFMVVVEDAVNGRENPQVTTWLHLY